MYVRELPPRPQEPAGLIDQLGEYARPRTFDETDRPYQDLMDLARAVDLLGDIADVDLAIAKVDKRGPRVIEIPSMHDRQREYHAGAYAHFARAQRAYDRIELGEEPQAVHHETWNQFRTFKTAYEGAEADKYQARSDYKRLLAGNFAALVALDEAAKAEPEIPERPVPGIKPGEETYPEILGEGDEVEFTLTTRDKVRVLAHEDQRAGFLPTTHREKNSAVELLDYMGREIVNPATGRKLKTPEAIDDRLTQIYIRQVNKRQEKHAKAKAEAGDSWEGPSDEAVAAEARDIAVDSVRSVINEWDDYRADAKHSKRALIDLKELVSNHGAPNTKLVDLLRFPEAEGIDTIPFLRFVVLRFFCETGELPAFDPLVTREIRPAPPEFITKNKVVTDTFRFDADKPAVVEEVTAMTAVITKKTVLELIDESIKDADNRHRFFVRARNGVTGVHAEYARSVSRASRTVA